MTQHWLLSAGEDLLQLDGNLFAHNFTFSHEGTTVATVTKAWVSLTDTYGVDIADGENDVLILAAVLGLEAEQNAEQRRNSSMFGR